MNYEDPDLPWGNRDTYLGSSDLRFHFHLTASEDLFSPYLVAFNPWKIERGIAYLCRNEFYNIQSNLLF